MKVNARTLFTMRFLLLSLVVFLFSCNSASEKKPINPDEPQVISTVVTGTDTILTLKYLYANGNVKAIQEHNSKGYKHGWQKEFYMNGTLKQEIYLIGEKLWAVGKGNTEDGKALDLGNLNFGTGYFILYNDSGIPAVKGFMKNDFKDSLWSYFSGGNVRKEISWHHGLQHGVTKYYFPNGGIQSTEMWNNGELKVLKSYYESGNLYKEMNFTNSKLNGVSKEYYDEKDKIRQTRDYKEGIENGYILYYDPKGYILQKGKMRNGEPVDTLFFYNEKGQVMDMKINKVNTMPRSKGI